MQITAKLREEILFALPKLAVKQAEKIAKKCNVSKDTVYRQYRRLRISENPMLDNPVIIAIGELAASRIDDAKKSHDRAKAIEKQFSEKSMA